MNCTFLTSTKIFKSSGTNERSVVSVVHVISSLKMVFKVFIINSKSNNLVLLLLSHLPGWDKPLQSYILPETKIISSWFYCFTKVNRSNNKFPKYLNPFNYFSSCKPISISFIRNLISSILSLTSLLLLCHYHLFVQVQSNGATDF